MRCRLDICLLAIMLLSVSAGAAVITVPGDQPDIASAVAVASTGDTISVGEGDFAETGQIVVGRSISIVGAGEAVTKVRKVDDTGSTGDAACWFRVAPGVQLIMSDLTLDGDGRSIYEGIRSYGTLTLGRCTLRNISAPDFSGAAVVLLGNGTIDSCSFLNVGCIGVLASGTACANVIVNGCEYRGKGAGEHLDYGIVLDAGAVGTITNNDITDCGGVRSLDGARSAGIRVIGMPSGASSGTLRYNTVSRCSIGIDVARDIGDTSVVLAQYNHIAGNSLGVRYSGRDSNSANFRSNWWGSSVGPGPTGSGQGDRFSGTILWSPYLLIPTANNSLYLEASWSGSVYTRPGRPVVVWMRVARLQQVVKGCQAMLGYDSGYFDVGSVAAGGGDWDEVVYSSWAVPGELDTAIGVKGASSVGSQLDATVAVITLNARNSEGITQLVFRPDDVPDPGLVGSTIFSTLEGGAVWPRKIDGTNIYVDGTPPTIDIFSASQGSQELIDTGACAQEGTVLIRVRATDALSGVSMRPTVAVTPNGGAPSTATYLNESPSGYFNYVFQVGPSTPYGPAVVAAVGSDRSGNTAAASQKTINIGWPHSGNVLYLESLTTYVKPGDPVNVRMGVADLMQMVKGCQAMLGFDSSYLNIGTVAAGGGDWDELIYESWVIDGEIDTAVGVKGNSTAGTQADGTVATISLTAKQHEGLTQLVFRPDLSPDPGLVKSTILCDMNGHAVWPGKVNSSSICIDGTPPTLSIAAARQGGQDLIGTGAPAVQGAVSIRITADDVLAGLQGPPAVTVTPQGGQPEAATFVRVEEGDYYYTWTVTPTTHEGPAVIDALAADRAGNSAQAEPRSIDVVITTNNVLYLEGQVGGPIYVRPLFSAVVAMKVSHLQERVVGCQAMLGYDSSFFSVGNVLPGGGDWDEVIYQSWTVPGELDTAIGVRTQASTGTIADGSIALLVLTTRNVEGITRVVFRPDADPDPGLVKSTFFSSLQGTAVWPAKLDSTLIYVDGTAPEIQIASAQQAGQELIGTAVRAVKGTVNITVTASDALSGLTGAPTVTVTPSGGSAQTATYVGEGPAGTFNYTWTVTSSTYNGAAVIRATVYDRAGMGATVTRTITVNKNTISGQIECESFLGLSREIDFVATGTQRKAWTMTVTGFVNGIASYVLSDVPDGPNSLSACTDWHLRRKLNLSGGLNGQWTANFVGQYKLLGGDLDRSNLVNLMDYSLLKAHWFTTSSEADINGDGQVNLADYTIMKSNWYVTGHPE